MSLIEHCTDPLSEKIIGAAIEVHRHLGPGLLESAYEECLCHELRLRGLQFMRQVVVPLRYKDHLLPVHTAQVITYLKLTLVDVGLLLNFNSPTIKQGLRRLSLKKS